MKLLISKYLAILPVFLVKDCYGYVSLRPEHQIVRVGGEAKFVCESDMTKYVVNWLNSPDPPDVPLSVIYDGGAKSSLQNRYVVTEIVEAVKRRSDLTIKNIGFEDSGVIFCSDEGGFGTPQEASLSVADGIDCSSACVNDQFLMTCSSCYWMGRQTSKDEHHPALNHFLQISESDEYITSNTSIESYDSNKNCNQMKSIWALNMSCKVFDKHNSIKPVVLLSSDLENVRKVNLTSETIRVLVENRILDITTVCNGWTTKIRGDKLVCTTRLWITIGTLIAIVTISYFVFATVLCVRRKRNILNSTQDMSDDEAKRRKRNDIPLLNTTQDTYDDEAKVGTVERKKRNENPFLNATQETSDTSEAKPLQEDRKPDNNRYDDTNFRGSVEYSEEHEATGVPVQSLQTLYPSLELCKEPRYQSQKTTGLHSLQPHHNRDDSECSKGMKPSGFFSLQPKHDDNAYSTDILKVIQPSGHDIREDSINQIKSI